MKRKIELTKKSLMQLNGKKLLKVIYKLGYTETTRKSGSHRIFKADNRPTLSIPRHGANNQISTGTKRNIIKLLLTSI